MVVGLRVLACVLDVAVVFFSLPMLVYPLGLLMDLSGDAGLLLLPLCLTFMVAWPVIYFALPMALWGCTPAKWICRLRVRGVDGQRASVWRALGREALRLLGMYFVLGLIIALVQALYDTPAWYDRLCKTEVVYLARLTGNQRQFRSVFPNQRRGL